MHIIQTGNVAAGSSNVISGNSSNNNANETIDLSLQKVGANCTTPNLQQQQQKKRKFSESSDHSEHHSANEYDHLNKKLKIEQFDFLYSYFMQNEQNDDVKKQNVDFELLYNYYQTNELKKKGNFDFLYQYYVQNEKLSSSSSMQEMQEKPSFEFLFQYYQINESKKFFQLEASPQKNDFMLMNLTSTPKQQNSSSSLAATQLAVAAAAAAAAVAAAGAVTGTPQTTQHTTSTSHSHQPSEVNLLHHSAAAALNNNNSNCSSTTSISTMVPITSSASLGAGTTTVGDLTGLTAAEKQNNKRLRTTILPEQLNFLYECYQNESNPSRKMLEEISKKVNLKKRVVQVKQFNSCCFIFFSFFFCSKCFFVFII